MSDRIRRHGLQWSERYPAAATGVLSVVSTIASAFATWRTISSTLALNPVRVFCTYLWASTSAILTLTMIAWWFHHRLGSRVAEIRRCENWIELQHYFAEQVRLCAANADKFVWSDKLQIACVKIIEILSRHVHGVPFAITVKVLGNSRLRTVLRDPSQDAERRKPGDDIGLKDSPVYRQFHEYSRKERQFVYIEDTDDLTGPKGFKHRAKEGCFKSILAFPLRVPEYPPNQDGSAAPEMTTRTLRGFLSIDAPFPKAFDAMFHTALRGSSSRDLREELHAFFGIADSIATIVMLKELANRNR